ncbi:synaptonemal complex central element protein 1-like isoform X7 [Nycticebus coucang]|uniref:synaptonemal complex central element protein 1-like isoform X7 n=1 Tax=Nycticebus coucang TaxID=9470 RepID=UPI00234CE981|nr:synaptonemal complex central element protein 1-like isoform X7 [Nycticebus coucang]XP_053464722.1 synaptonemal complex central element protein 1-like isoform X7 [Nycticebus coucang]
MNFSKCPLPFFGLEKKKSGEELGETRALWEALRRELDSLNEEKVHLEEVLSKKKDVAAATGPRDPSPGEEQGAAAGREEAGEHQAAGGGAEAALTAPGRGLRGSERGAEGGAREIRGASLERPRGRGWQRRGRETEEPRRGEQRLSQEGRVGSSVVLSEWILRGTGVVVVVLLLLLLSAPEGAAEAAAQGQGLAGDRQAGLELTRVCLVRDNLLFVPDSQLPQAEPEVPGACEEENLRPPAGDPDTH